MRPYMFTASLVAGSASPPRCRPCASCAAEPELRERIARNSERLFHGFRALGLSTRLFRPEPVIAVRCPDEMSCYAMWHALLEHGVYVNMAIPPGTPGGLCLLRCSVSAAHTSDDIDEIIALFGAVVSKAPRRVANG